MEFTKHAQTRKQQRGFSDIAVEIIMECGKISDAPGGAYKLSFGKKEYTDAISKLKKMIKTLDRAKGGSLIVANGQVITIYKAN